jgi:hypothetical protein
MHVARRHLGECGRPLPGISLGFGPTRVRLDGDVNFYARLQGYRFPVFILQRILDADLAVEVVRALHPDLRLLGLARMRRRDDLLNRSREGHRRLPAVGFVVRMCVQTAPFSTSGGPGILGLAAGFSKVSRFTATST